MYRKIHKRLTFVFTGITSLILILLSACCFCLFERTLQKNSFLSFSEEMNTLISHLEQQTVISYEWLSGVSGNGRYLIAVYDKEVPLSYNADVLSRDDLSLMTEVFSSCADTIQSVPKPDSFHSAHREFHYASKEAGDFYVCFARIRDPLGYASGNLTAVILYSAGKLSDQILTARICFVCVNLCGTLLLFLFSWYYTGRLLSPIRKSQENQTAFIAAASHELRTPLCVILSSLSALTCASEDGKNRFLQTIEQEIRRMSRLVTDMLTLAQADSHTWSFHFTETELDTLLLDALEAFQPLAAEKRISLTAELPDEIFPPCFCDRERIQQVFHILISNAVSYGSEGGFLKVTAVFQNNEFVLRFTDNGIGISKETKEHIFDRFYRGDSSRSGKEHLGLGLCIAKEILNAHHGSIYAEDNPGGGTVFIVRLGGASGR